MLNQTDIIKLKLLGYDNLVIRRMNEISVKEYNTINNSILCKTNDNSFFVFSMENYCHVLLKTDMWMYININRPIADYTGLYKSHMYTINDILTKYHPPI
jgi:hypothetical protein